MALIIFDRLLHCQHTLTSASGDASPILSSWTNTEGSALAYASSSSALTRLGDLTVSRLGFWARHCGALVCSFQHFELQNHPSWHATLKFANFTWHTWHGVEFHSSVSVSVSLSDSGAGALGLSCSVTSCRCNAALLSTRVFARGLSVVFARGGSFYHRWHFLVINRHW